MGASKKGDDATAIAIVMLLCVGFLALAWPYLLGTWLAVGMGADNPSTARDVVGWTLEVIWLVFLVAMLMAWWVDKQRKKAEARRLELEAQQRKRDFGAAGARLYEQAAASVSEIAESEAAGAGWLGDPADFDFRADLNTIAANLRRAEEIRKIKNEGASIKHLTPADKKILDDAQQAVTTLYYAAKERFTLIGECAQQAADIDRQLADDRERGVMAKRREDLRNRLGPMLYGTQTPSADIPSESADVVKARAAAFRELRGVLRNYRLDGDGG